MAISSMAKTFRSVLRAGATVALLLPVSQAAPAASAPTQVDLKLVLATDVSGSVDNDEFRIQRDGTAAAFADPDVVKAIQSGSLGRIAVAMFDFSSPQFAKIIIDWHIIKDRASAEAFADLSAGRARLARVRAASRQHRAQTARSRPASGKASRQLRERQHSPD